MVYQRKELAELQTIHDAMEPDGKYLRSFIPYLDISREGRLPGTSKKVL